MKEAFLYQKLADNKIRCQVCNHQCLVSPGNRGICGVRQNVNGKFYCLNYGKAISLEVDPIEKKPLFHFLPGTTALSFATIGCNFRCDNCQNWQISQGAKDYPEIPGQKISSEQIIETAQKENCDSIAYTYTEPTIFLEYAFDVMKLATKAGLKNVWVSNGYMTSATLKMITPCLDAINVDLKFFDDETYKHNCGAKLKPILDNLQQIKKAGIHLEITTLSIPTLSDSADLFSQIADFIKIKLGSNTPWHISAFSPAISHKLTALSPTSLNTLYQARQIAQQKGLQYVYLGNVPGDPGENTYCPKCQKMVIKRIGYQVSRLDNEGKCPDCQQPLNLILKSK